MSHCEATQKIVQSPYAAMLIILEVVIIVVVNEDKIISYLGCLVMSPDGSCSECPCVDQSIETSLIRAALRWNYWTTMPMAPANFLKHAVLLCVSGSRSIVLRLDGRLAGLVRHTDYCAQVSNCILKWNYHEVANHSTKLDTLIILICLQLVISKLNWYKEIMGVSTVLEGHMPRE